MHQDKDRTAKWLLTHHGDAILKLAGITGFTSWRHLPSEVVAPRRTMDGLIEARFPGKAEPTLVLVEIEAYAGSDADRQVFDDLMLVALEYRRIPEVVSLILKPKGKVRVHGKHFGESPSGTTRIQARWPVVCLWDLNAEELLCDGDIGLVPWVLLASAAKPVEDILGECVGRIRGVIDPTERAGLLAVTYILAGFAHPDINLYSIFGGADMIIDFESVGMKELGEGYRQRYQNQWKLESLRQLNVELLQERFGPLPADRAEPLENISDENRLRQLMQVAVTCRTLDDFFAEAAKQ